MLVARITLSVASFLFFGLQWYNVYKEFKGLIADAILKAIFAISALYTLGVVGLMALIWL